MEPTSKKQKTAGFNFPIPPSLLTPSQVQSRLGTFNFFDGIPDASSAERLFDCLDLFRGVDCFLDLVPMASLEAMRMGHVSMGIKGCSDAIIMDTLMDSAPLFLTGNTDTVYCSIFLDLECDGPTVVEVPPGCGPGTVNDAFFRFVIDTGSVGPDRGQGGKYLLLPPEYEGLDPPEGGAEAVVGGVKYFAAKSKSYVNWLILRGFLVDGKPDLATKMFKEGLKVYPLSSAASPPEMTFTSCSERFMNTVHSNDFDFYQEIHAVLSKEPIGLIDPELRGKAASIGIQKGKPFEPSDKLRKTLVEAVAVANGMARAISFMPRDEEAWIYGRENNWYTPFVGGDYRWLRNKGAGGRNQDARLLFFYLATVNTPAIVLKMVGKGSQYAVVAADAMGAPLDGAATYSLTLPKDVPAKDFWSFVIYDPQTRSQLQTGQPFPSKNSVKNKEMQYNPDGSITLHFSPQAPAGKQSNWIQTVPGKAWFALLRLYGPLDAWFDKTWRPGQIIQH
ncbi:unnamed protein product [Polarella glacialis]|uniref:DUF1254 domain-containing protein n=1 Tax=Polarella glacialis TaxID=89957 RepID=A0A813KKB9_POLGL|nr:unnamed protein product [Polarella glacialis]